MDISGYWATLASMIVGLGITDLLVNLHRLLHGRSRVTWDALPLVWALITLLLLFNFWWATAMNLDGSRDARVVGQFVLLAISPIILFLMSASVLPRDMPGEGRLDMKAAWASARRVFIVLFWVRQIVTGVTASVAAGGFIWDQAMMNRILIFALLTPSLVWSSRRLEWLAAIGILATMVWRISLQSVQ